jgi:hypothetical protein
LLAKINLGKHLSPVSQLDPYFPRKYCQIIMASSDASQVTVASLPRLSAGELSDILLKQGTESLNLKDDIAIIDVRDDGK